MNVLGPHNNNQQDYAIVNVAQPAQGAMGHRSILIFNTVMFGSLLFGAGLLGTCYSRQGCSEVTRSIALVIIGLSGVVGIFRSCFVCERALFD